MIQKTTAQQNRWNARRLRQAFITNAVFGMDEYSVPRDTMLRYERNTC